MFSWRPGGLKWEEYRTAAILIAPAMLGIVIFSFIPIIQAFSTSFYDAPLLSPRRQLQRIAALLEGDVSKAVCGGNAATLFSDLRNT